MSPSNTVDPLSFFLTIMAILACGLISGFIAGYHSRNWSKRAEEFKKRSDESSPECLSAAPPSSSAALAERCDATIPPRHYRLAAQHRLYSTRRGEKWTCGCPSCALVRLKVPDFEQRMAATRPTPTIGVDYQ